MRAIDYESLHLFEQPLELALKAKIGDIGIPWFTRLDALKFDPASQLFDFQKIRPRGEIHVARFNRADLNFQHLVLRDDGTGDIQEEKYTRAFGGEVMFYVVTPFTPKLITAGDHVRYKSALMVRLARCEKIEDEALLPFHTLDKLWFREAENEIVASKNLEVTIMKYEFHMSVRDDAWPNENETQHTES